MYLLDTFYYVYNLFMSILSMFFFILKITFLGYGGGNAMMPIIRKESVTKKKWLTDKEFDELVIVTNTIPGPSVMEALAYISMLKLGKLKGSIVAFFGIFPHIMLPLGLYVTLSKYVPAEYIVALNIGVMPVIIAVLLLFAWRYIKISHKEISEPLMISIIIFTICFSLFVPAPFNIPAIIILAIMIGTYLYGKFIAKGDK